MGYALESFEIGINHTNTDDERLLSATKAICKYYATPKELLYRYIPKTSGVRSTSAYNVLIFIHCVPSSTMLHVSENIHSDTTTVKRCVIYLKSLGLIRMMPQQRYIAPFNSYKQERTYLITPKGKTVLSKLLNY